MKIGSNRTRDGIVMKLSPLLLNMFELLSLLVRLFNRPKVPLFPKFPMFPIDDNIEPIFKLP